ncbi:hypothetical protein [Gordonia sp. NPDC003950]
MNALVMIAIITILATRAYLAATGFPQIGGKTLHIAHALWGGAAMVFAVLLLLWFGGRRARTIAVVLGGIGLGLFLDEVGKFVTKTNDYFFAPAVSIMYVVLVVLLLISRAIQDLGRHNAGDDLTEAYFRIGEAVSVGVSDRERQEIDVLLASARSEGVSAEVTAHASAALADVAPRTPGAGERLVAKALVGQHNFVVGARVTAIIAALLTIFSLAGLVSAALTISDDTARGTGVAVTSIGQFCGSALAFGLCVAALVTHVLRRGRLWPLRMLRAAALTTMLLTEVFDFVDEQFGALINVGVGLVALAVFSSRLWQLRRAQLVDAG